jgi:DnaJ-domain-containing protein 1
MQLSGKQVGECMENGIYIYGIIKTSNYQVFGEIGIGDKAASTVLTIGFKDLAAVVSNSPLMVYDSLRKEKVVKDLAIHQFVIEKVMERCTIVPVKFGTMVETEDEVIKFLEEGYVLLSNELGKMEGKIELDLVAWCELPKILATVSRHNSQIQERQRELALKGEKVTIEDKIMLGQSVERALKAEKARYHQLILQTLKQETEDICLHDLANDEMIFNAAFLLEKKKEELFHTLVDTLDQKFDYMLNFRIVGPLPAYSFSTIVFKKTDPDTIEKAKKTLHLTGEITDKTLRDAYHRLVKEYHPDKSSDEDAQKFQLIHAAYGTLKDFIENGLVHTEVYRWKQDVQ